MSERIENVMFGAAVIAILVSATSTLLLSWDNVGCVSGAIAGILIGVAFLAKSLRESRQRAAFAERYYRIHGEDEP